MGDMGAAEAGNYKGVMLCNRPAEQPSRPPVAAAAAPATFKPVGVPSEPIGLNPAKENLMNNLSRMHEESQRRRAEAPPENQQTNFMSKHRAWLADMAKKKAELNHELQASAKAAEAKRTKFVAYTSALRSAVRQRSDELEAEAMAEAGMMEDMASTGAFPPTQAEEEPPLLRLSKPRPPPAKPSKPAWAMTEGEADDAEDEEAAQLLEFASALDYDSYIDDLEVRQALNVIRERIDAQKALEAAASAAEDADGTEGDWRSQFLNEWNGDGDDATSTRSKRMPVRGAAAGEEGEGGRPEWDSSTNAGDERKGGSYDTARAMADQLLRENPNLAAKHSAKSLASMVERVPVTRVEDLPPLRVVTVVENPKVPTKMVDPSNLPYLHRNPAV